MIPIYRARFLYDETDDINESDSDYIEGYYKDIHKILSSINEGHYIQAVGETETYEIDPSTLAIHFPDMLDKNGKPIFASLSEDGVGGDNLDYNSNGESFGVVTFISGELSATGNQCYIRAGSFKNCEATGIYKGKDND